MVMVMAMSTVTIWLRLAWKAVVTETVLEDEHVVLLTYALAGHKRVQDGGQWECCSALDLAVPLRVAGAGGLVEDPVLGLALALLADVRDFEERERVNRNWSIFLDAILRPGSSTAVVAEVMLEDGTVVLLADAPLVPPLVEEWVRVRLCLSKVFDAVLVGHVDVIDEEARA